VSDVATSVPAPEPVPSGNTITGATDGDAIRESVRQLNEQRSRDGTLGRDEIIERKWGEPGEVKLKDAAKAFSEQHKSPSSPMQSGATSPLWAQTPTRMNSP
jgi:hypothetical protein